MPNRLIREGFLDSESINALSESAECFYHRLLLIVDDAGRMDARSGLLLARLYPLGTERSADDILGLLHECEQHGLLRCYTYEERPYVQLSRWQRPGNSFYSKFPWRDGTHRVSWTKRETRDGTKEFCTTSLPAAPVSKRRTADRGEMAVGDRRGKIGVSGGVKGGGIGGGTAGVPGVLSAGGEAGTPFFAAESDPIEGDSRHLSEDGDEVEVVLSPLPPHSAEPGAEQSASRPASGEAEPSRPLAAGREGGSGRSMTSGTPEGNECGAGFTEFWNAYPKKRGRDAARRVWLQRRPPLAQCLAAIEKLRRTEEWRKEQGQFIPHPANWLSSGGWQDVPEVDLRRRRPEDGFLQADGSPESQGATKSKWPLLPGESPPEPMRDPAIWPEYVALHPEFLGKHLADLTHLEQETFKNWAFERQREAFLEEKEKLMLRT